LIFFVFLVVSFTLFRCSANQTAIINITFLHSHGVQEILQQCNTEGLKRWTTGLKTIFTTSEKNSTIEKILLLKIAKTLQKEKTQKLKLKQLQGLNGGWGT